MELVDGPSLAAELAKKKPLAVREAARIGYEVALGLEHARRCGIVHRDIKPSNILLSRQGKVKVADLGLAKFFGPESRESGPETRTGQFMGTIDYCAPEQAEDAKRADIRSDIYSLGCTLYHCLTGEPPFPEGTEVQRIMAHIELLPAHILEKNRKVPPALAELIEHRMLAKRPADRFQTPAEAAEALKPWATGEQAAAGSLWAALGGVEELLKEVAPASRSLVPVVEVRREHVPAGRRYRNPRNSFDGTAPSRLSANAGLAIPRPLRWVAGVSAVLAAIAAASLLWWTKVDHPAMVENVRGDGARDAEAAPSQPASSGSITPVGTQIGVVNESTVDSDVRPKEADEAMPVTRGGAGDSPGGLEPSSSGVTNTSNPQDSPPPKRTEAGADAKRGDRESGEPASAPMPPGFVLTVKHGGAIRAVAVSADGSTLLTGGDDKAARLWNAADGAPRGTPLTHDHEVIRVSLSPDGRYAITQQNPHPLASLWDLSVAGVAPKPLFTAVPGPMAFGADGHELAALGMDARAAFFLRRYDLSKGNWRDTPIKFRREYRLWPALFSPDLQLLAIGGTRVTAERAGKEFDQTKIDFWETQKGKLRGGSARFEQGDEAFNFAFRPDGRTLAIAHAQPKLRFVHVPSGLEVDEFTSGERIVQIAFNPRGDVLVCIGQESGKVELRDAQTGEIRGPPSAMRGAATAAFSPDGQRLFIGNVDGTATLWQCDALFGQ